MREPSSSAERGTLEQLCGDEAELERRLVESRRTAAEIVAAARGEAARIVAEARAGLVRELAALREERGAEDEREDARTRDSVTAEVAALARRVERNRSRALARLIELVLGRGP